MKLDGRLAKTLRDLNAAPLSLSSQDAISLIDLTLLDTHATPDAIQNLAHRAAQHKVAAICILPEHLAWVAPEIAVRRATVVNFPTGAQPQQQVLSAIEQAATMQLDEVDYVFPYQDYLSGCRNDALAYCQQAYQLCKEYNLLFKVILETGALPSNEVIYEISTAVIQNGCDFLKTSTGKISIGATIPAVFSMLCAIVDSKVNCGIKVSGGVKTAEQVLEYMRLAQFMMGHSLDAHCFRVGASSLLDELMIENSVGSK